MSNKIQFIQLEDGTQQISETGVITFSAGSILRVDTSTISNSLDVVNVEYLTNNTLTDAQIKTKYENNANTNEFSDSEKSKLAGLDSSKFLGEYVSLGALQTAHSSPAVGSYANVDSGASSDVERYIWDDSDNAYVLQLGVSIALTDAQIKTQYENNANTNAFTDSEKTAVSTNSSKVTNATHTGDVTGSGALTIASNVVAEDNLEINNSPTDGYVLTALASASGGLTWQAASSIRALTNGQIFIGNSSNEAASVAMSGDTTISNTGVVTIGADKVTYDKMQDTTQAALLGNQTGAGTVGEIPIVEAYIPAGATRTLLETTTNWDVNGNYTGASITGTYQGQNHYNGNYWFTAVDDNVWIRLIRG